MPVKPRNHETAPALVITRSGKKPQNREPFRRISNLLQSNHPSGARPIGTFTPAPGSTVGFFFFFTIGRHISTILRQHFFDHPRSAHSGKPLSGLFILSD
jgi:hypothetical protein